ncbi:MAG: RtcB family protein, partial [Planctomycetota bacterium]
MEHIAVMPDVHLAEHVCIGTVVGTSDRLYPQAVGGDIGCGIAAVALAGTAAALADAAAAERLFAALRDQVPSRRQRRRRELDALGLTDAALARSAHRDLQFEL